MAKRVERDLVTEQAELLDLLVNSIPPDVMEAIEFAYHWENDVEPELSVCASTEGTAYA